MQKMKRKRKNNEKRLYIPYGWGNYNMIKKQKLLYNIILTFEVKRDTFNNFIDKSPFNT